MIFVTVGTHEQQFNRLIKKVDDLVADGSINEKVIIQTGYSDYVPRYCEYQKLYSYQDMQKYMQEARIVITHGGPSSFIVSIQMGKIPIVVPRQKKYGEHVNDHQVVFCKEVYKRLGNIIYVENIENLEQEMKNHNNARNKGIKNNNLFFCNEIDKVIR